MARKSHIASAAVLINIVAALCTALWLYNIIKNDGLIAPNLPVWLALIIFAWLANIFFLRKPRSIVQIVLFNVLPAALIVGCLWLLMPQDVPVFSYTLLLAAGIATAVLAAYFAVSPAFSDHLLPVFELSFVVLVILMWVKDLLGFSNMVLLPAVLAFLTNLLALVLVRVCTPSANSAGQSRIKGLTVLLIILVAVLLLVAVFSVFLAAPLEELALMLVDAVVAAFQQLMAWISQFFDWLFDLLGLEFEEVKVPEDMIEQDEIPDNYTAPPTEVGFIVIGLGLALLAFLIYKLRKKKFKLNINRPSMLWIKRFFDSVRHTLTEIGQKIADALRSLWFKIKYKNTLYGLFYAVERYGKKCGLARQSGETPHNYWQRLAEYAAACDDSRSAAQLMELSSITDDCFYSAKPSSLLKPEEIRAMQKDIAAFLKRHKKK